MLNNTEDINQSLMRDTMKTTEEDEKKEEKPKPKENNQIPDKAVAMYSISWAFGAFLAPIIGGGLYDAKGFAFTSNLMAGFVLLFAIVYFSIIFGCYYLKKCCRTEKL